MRQLSLLRNGMVVNRTEVLIGNAAQRFDAEGRLTDEKTPVSISERCCSR